MWAMAAWRVDAHGNFFVIRPLDLSVGVAQIKPRTAMSALVIRAAADGLYHDDLLWPRILRAAVNYKDYRELPRLGNRWQLPGATFASLESPFAGPVPKSEVVKQLFDDRQNIEMCALILALYAAQWEAANPTWSIRGRPEILATLYQLGFERSWPKRDPRPNRFGERVAEVHRSRFIQGSFGPGQARA